MGCVKGRNLIWGVCLRRVCGTGDTCFWIVLVVVLVLEIGNEDDNEDEES